MGRLIPTLTNDQIKTFWSKVQISDDDSCWLWQAGTYDGSRGRFCINGDDYVASRVAFFISTGKQPAKLDVCHACDNPGCCNPRHLWVGPRAANNKDRAIKGRSAPVKGSMNPRSKLTEAVIIRNSSKTCKELGEEYGVDPALIHRINHRRSWSHV